MTRTIARALTRALPLIVLTIFATSAHAVMTGDTPTITDQTTGSTYTQPSPTEPNIAVGDTLLGVDHDWAGNGGVYTYQWKRCWDGGGAICDLIVGATNAAYDLTAPDWGATIVFCTTVPRGLSKCSAPTRVVQAAHPDTDGDGVPDYEDACTSTAGSDNGCPPPGAPVDLVPPPAATPVPPAPAAPLDQEAPGPGRTASVARQLPTQRVAFGKRALVGSRLLAPDGRPIGGATVIVRSKPRIPGATFNDEARVVTRRDGTFSYTAPAGASRTIEFVYTGTANGATVASTADMTLLVKGALIFVPTKRKLRNGSVTTFTGRIKGSLLPAKGVLVDLQVWFHRKWRTFATPRTNAHGAYHYRYRFTQGAAKWIFRARTRGDSAYPYELAYSRKAAVTVTR